MWFQLVNIIGNILYIYLYLLIAVAIMSWIPDVAETQLGRILRRITDPYLNLFRRFIPPLNLGGMMLDIAFFIAFFVYYLAINEVIRLLNSFG
ncbi:YggT family protein [Alicyclobacillus sp. SO9]|uniref:YggT family protein n=1 Tax=Alicyclobacillus sp. SO9 TaxID=2665646 RepID=UPI0018E72672|nr:YggT family protein [Alicyclobacillus sp. SO9]QQE80718.1 YggT family protein [Alicyclobacillus sp. SO9]